MAHWGLRQNNLVQSLSTGYEGAMGHKKRVLSPVDINLSNDNILLDSVEPTNVNSTKEVLRIGRPYNVTSFQSFV